MKWPFLLLLLLPRLALAAPAMTDDDDNLASLRPLIPRHRQLEIEHGQCRLERSREDRMERSARIAYTIMFRMRQSEEDQEVPWIKVTEENLAIARAIEEESREYATNASILSNRYQGLCRFILTATMIRPGMGLVPIVHMTDRNKVVLGHADAYYEAELEAQLVHWYAKAMIRSIELALAETQPRCEKIMWNVTERIGYWCTPRGPRDRERDTVRIAPAKGRCRCFAYTHGSS